MYKYTDVRVLYAGRAMSVSRIFLAKESNIFRMMFVNNPDANEIPVDLHLINISFPASVECFFNYFLHCHIDDALLSEHKYDLFKLANFYEVGSLIQTILHTYVDGDVIDEHNIESIADDYEAMSEYPLRNAIYDKELKFLLWRLRWFYTQKLIVFDKHTEAEKKWLRSYRLPQRIRSTYIMDAKPTSSKQLYLQDNARNAWKPCYRFSCTIAADTQFIATPVNERNECGIPLYLSYKRKFSDVLYFGIACPLSFSRIQYRVYARIWCQIIIGKRVVETFTVMADFHLTNNNEDTREFLYHQLSITDAVIDTEVTLLAVCEEKVNDRVWLSDKFLSNSVVMNRACHFSSCK